MARIKRFVTKSAAQIHESVFSGYTEGNDDSETVNTLLYDHFYENITCKSNGLDCITSIYQLLRPQHRCTISLDYFRICFSISNLVTFIFYE
jgi:hypothetical protein